MHKTKFEIINIYEQTIKKKLRFINIS